MHKTSRSPPAAESDPPERRRDDSSARVFSGGLFIRCIKSIDRPRQHLPRMLTERIHNRTRSAFLLARSVSTTPPAPIPLSRENSPPYSPGSLADPRRCIGEASPS
jgi:hypothetical protein